MSDEKALEIKFIRVYTKQAGGFVESTGYGVQADIIAVDDARSQQTTRDDMSFKNLIRRTYSAYGLLEINRDVEEGTSNGQI